MPKFRKKPVVIEAIEWNGDMSSIEDMQLRSYCQAVAQGLGDPALYIETLEGTMKAELGDWIILGIKGEIYPCKPDIFEKTYELVEDGECA